MLNSSNARNGDAMKKRRKGRNWVAFFVIAALLILQMAYIASIAAREKASALLYVKSILGLLLVLFLGFRQDWARCLLTPLLLEEAWEASLSGIVGVYQQRRRDVIDLLIGISFVGAFLLSRSAYLERYTRLMKIVVSTRLIELALSVHAAIFFGIDTYQIVGVNIMKGQGMPFFIAFVGPVIGLYAAWVIYLKDFFSR